MMLVRRLAALIPSLRGGGVESTLRTLSWCRVLIVLMRADGNLQPLLDSRGEVVPLGVRKVYTVYDPIVGVAAAGMLGHATLPAWLPGGGKRVTGVGSLKQVKRFDLLIEAFAHLPNKDAVLVILGEGGELAALEAQMRALGLEGKVCLPGFASNPTPALRSADLFVLSSDYEGF